MNKVIFFVSSTVLFLFFTTASHASPILSISPETQTVSTRAPVLFDVNITGLATGIALAAFDINIDFDSTLLSLTNVAFGDPLLLGIDQLDPLNLAMSLPLAKPSFGLVNLIDISLYDPAILIAAQSSSFTLAILSFDTLAAGISPITLSINSLSNANAAILQASIQSGSVTITDHLSPNTIPEPAPFLLLMLSGLSFSLTQHRKRFI
jgi:hypothetical protein